ncbi:hypothetical protein AAFF_G00101160 [Aldrovandia affinis]|uniref:Uncharacterized protein n=1 Tax=Aldrovandia affinis TaxID=143900 RepID=A0AAD7RUP4_9TELE|nr:hypothetical protein AAFF_G00101160 [Aldrovandia affinis]
MADQKKKIGRRLQRGGRGREIQVGLVVAELESLCSVALLIKAGHAQGTRPALLLLHRQHSGADRASHPGPAALCLLSRLPARCSLPRETLLEWQRDQTSRAYLVSSASRRQVPRVLAQGCEQCVQQ